jgi:hypothetical protein
MLFVAEYLTDTSPEWSLLTLVFSTVEYGALKAAKTWAKMKNGSNFVDNVRIRVKIIRDDCDLQEAVFKWFDNHTKRFGWTIGIVQNLTMDTDINRYDADRLYELWKDRYQHGQPTAPESRVDILKVKLENLRKSYMAFADQDEMRAARKCLKDALEVKRELIRLGVPEEEIM